ncbi:urea carboxylase-associated family protein [Geochorda subterranea]|uniref:Urea carboxylase-associated family protein n=1 Tax=Geochorda subterranea TaxID=3109564 RepID=A0ABZ1BQM1_9FIRM|nr:urea carboxylase-associated family protein [Limnochorda sp. LNt]WRP15019.1 urea carboxylase-associated family protein [Limnochorda sp. LNt]
MVAVGECRLDIQLRPVSGVAVPLRRGEVLRIVQEEGQQPVSLNCFNLHDHKEHLSVGHMRREGFRTKEGRILWSNTPRYSPLAAILHMSQSCVADLLVPRCSAPMLEWLYGLVDHPNCQDILAECIGEYGLTPDDVHDPINLWLEVGVNHHGYIIRGATGHAGDHVDLLALTDILTVAAMCGLAHLLGAARSSYKPIRVQVFRHTIETEQLAKRYIQEYTGLKNQRTPQHYRNRSILAERTLRQVEGYQPTFYRVVGREIDVTFSPDEYLAIQRLRGQMGKTTAEVARVLFMRWYIKHRKALGLRYDPSEERSV